MPLVSFAELAAAAKEGGYAVGYFESWSLDSLLAVADAAQAARSPVILGFSGVYLFAPERCVGEPLEAYAAMALAVARGLSVPTCLLFNESPYIERVLQAVDAGFGMVMYSDEALAEAEQVAKVRMVVERAHAAGAAVEAEMAPVAGVDGELTEMPGDARLTDPAGARDFVAATGVDALAVNVGQAHLHGRGLTPLRLDRVAALREAVPVPLALHGASSVPEGDLREAVQRGIRKVNVGSVLKQAYLAALRSACTAVAPDANPYQVLGSGFPEDVLTAGRLAMQGEVERLMAILGSAGRA